MITPQAEQLGQEIETLRPRQIGALPLLDPILSALQVRRIVNELVPSQADIDPGRSVELLVLNRLLAPQPLYQVCDWFAETVLPEGLDIRPQQIYDNRPGRVEPCFRRRTGGPYPGLSPVKMIFRTELVSNVLESDKCIA